MTLKITKTMWLLLVAGIFFIAFISLGAVRTQQLNHQNKLQQELAQAQQKLDGLQLQRLSQRHEELEYQINQAVYQFESAKTALSQQVTSIALSTLLFDTAKLYGVEVTKINSAGTNKEKVEGITTSVLNVTVEVKGDIPALVRFVTKLNDELETGYVKSTSIVVSDKTKEGEAGEEEAGEKPTATIQVAIYTYQGG